jgi:hypothetical protein
MAKSPDDETSFALGMMTLSKQHRYIAEVDNVLKATPATPDAQLKQLAEDPSKMNGVLNTGKDSVSRLILNASNTLDVDGKFLFGVFAALKSGRAMNNNPERFAERHKSIVEGITEQLPAVDDGEKYREVFQQTVPAPIVTATPAAA